VLGWSAYLASSWTWCIGMFLPALLVRDFGLAAFVVFAVPNILGAAALGWTLDRRRAAAILDHHTAAVAGFSIVTLSFHLFAIWMLIEPVAVVATGSRTWAVPMALAPVVVAIFAASRLGRSRRPDRILGIGAWCISALMGVWLILLGASPGVPRVTGVAGDLAMLAPVVVFGFLLCPYLDITFLRARSEQTDRDARRSFALGFGALFLAMIVMTLLYAAELMRLPSLGLGRGDRFGVAGSLPTAAAAAILVHLVVQFTFTMLVHMRELKRARAPARRWAMVAAGVLLAAGVVVGLASGTNRTLLGLGATEVVYRAYLGFYGLALPAYVYLCVIPRRGRPRHSPAAAPQDRGPAARSLMVWAGTVAIASPLYWIGFVHFDERALIPGLAIVLFARVVVPARGTIASEPAISPGPTVAR